jgi:integrase
VPGGEVCISLRTRSFREAEHRAALVDEAFDDALRRARDNVTDAAGLNTILREYLRKLIDADLQRRMERPAGAPVYGYWWEPGDPGTAADADLQAIRQARESLRRDLAENSPKEMAEYAEQLIRQHGLPDHLLRPLTYGLIEAAIQGWEVAERRTLGTEALVFATDVEAALDLHSPSSNGSDYDPTPKPSAQLASSLVDAFGEWGRKSGGWRAGAENQAKVSLGMFLEVCGDKETGDYTRGDGDIFRTILRALPTNYRKSPKDRTKQLKEIIADADARGAKRIGDKTVKRHFWALSQFFVFLIETGQLPPGANNPGRGFTFNTKGSARKQRDMWSGDELRRLFTSPVWTGCHSFFRSRRGTEVIRDALFWLPLLGLFHGNRLEEFAQLRRSDVGQADGVWYLRITDDDGRQLKNVQSRRSVPLHPELINVGFIDYVEKVAPQPRQQIFPELVTGGTDRKFGYSFSKKFANYRKAIGLQRPGLDYHSFRHGVTTKLYQADVNEGWIDLLTGHESGGESRKRYLKDIPIPLLRDAIARVTFSEVSLIPLYVSHDSRTLSAEGVALVPVEAPKAAS